ncbi:MAG: hypothetical protein J6C37_01145, partial [Roseburia sp.]|nr:hypothetical protein [Roseburia sp.]
MGNTALCAIALILYFTGILKTPRKKKENGFELLVIGTILLIALTGLAALIFTVAGIPVTLFSMTTSIFALTVVLWGRCVWKKEIAKCRWPVFDAVSLLIILAVILLAAVKRFGINLNLNYGGVDSARYFQLAMEVLESKEVSGEFLTDLLNAMFIAFFQPFLPSVSYYKAFIAADVFVHLLSGAMFYFLISKINCGKGRWWNPVLTLLYFGGYPLYNLTSGGFLHWVDGMLMVMFVIYAVLLLMRREIAEGKGILYLLCGLFGVICFYPILLIMVGPMLLPEAVVWCKDNLKRLPKKMLIALGILILLVAGGIVLVVGQRVNHSWDKVFYSLTVEGTIYREPYMDFLFFVPVLFCFFMLL